MRFKNILIAATMASLSAGAYAQVPFDHGHAFGRSEAIVDHHGGRAEIEHRLQHQGERIFRKFRAGLITPVQASALRADDDRVRNELQGMVARHDGFLTREDRIVLNHQLDGIGLRIGR